MQSLTVIGYGDISDRRTLRLVQQAEHQPKLKKRWNA